MSDVHLSDIGTKFLVTVYDADVVMNISTATTKKIVFRTPDGTVVEKAAIFETDGTDGKMYYITLTGDLDQTGRWHIQASLALPAGSWKSSIEYFNVLENL